MTDLSGYEARNAEREKIKAAATEGPWKIEYQNDTGPSDESFCEWYDVGPCSADAKTDAAFIAHARNDEVERDIRELIAMVKARDARIAELERDAARWKWCEENAVNEYSFNEPPLTKYSATAIGPIGKGFAAAVDAAIEKGKA